MIKLKLKETEKFLTNDYYINNNITIKDFMESFVKGIKEEEGSVYFLYGTKDIHKLFNICFYDTETIENKETHKKSTKKNIKYSDNYDKFIKKFENIIPQKIGIYNNNENVIDYYLVYLDEKIIERMKF